MPVSFRSGWADRLDCRQCDAHLELDPSTPWTAFFAYATGGYAVLWAFASLARLAAVPHPWPLKLGLACLVFPLAMRVALLRFGRYRVASSSELRRVKASNVLNVLLLVVAALVITVWSLDLLVSANLAVVVESLGWVAATVLILSIVDSIRLIARQRRQSGKAA